MIYTGYEFQNPLLVSQTVASAALGKVCGPLYLFATYSANLMKDTSVLSGVIPRIKKLRGDVFSDL